MEGKVEVVVRLLASLYTVSQKESPRDGKSAKQTTAPVAKSVFVSLTDSAGSVVQQVRSQFCDTGERRANQGIFVQLYVVLRLLRAHILK